MYARERWRDSTHTHTYYCGEFVETCNHYRKYNEIYTLHIFRKMHSSTHLNLAHLMEMNTSTPFIATVEWFLPAYYTCSHKDSTTFQIVASKWRIWKLVATNRVYTEIKHLVLAGLTQTKNLFCSWCLGAAVIFNRHMSWASITWTNSHNSLFTSFIQQWIHDATMNEMKMI